MVNIKIQRDGKYPNG